MEAKINLPEKIIQRQILGYLKPICKAVGKTKTTGLYDRGKKCYRSDPFIFWGFPDLCGFDREGKIFFCEVKSAKGRQSEYQIAFQNLCLSSGIRYILARSVEDVMAVIK